MYEFDGGGIEALPFTADTLLTSSFKFSEDYVVVGGKETITYGVNSKNGQVNVVYLDKDLVFIAKICTGKYFGKRL